MSNQAMKINKCILNVYIAIWSSSFENVAYCMISKNVIIENYCHSKNITVYQVFGGKGEFFMTVKLFCMILYMVTVHGNWQTVHLSKPMELYSTKVEISVCNLRNHLVYWGCQDEIQTVTSQPNNIAT
jgi:hypothetical protein